MNTNNTPPTGIFGNTKSRQSQATAGRLGNMSEKRKMAINVGIGIVFAIIGIMLAQADLGFAWNLIIAGVMIWSAGKLTSLKIQAVKPWEIILRLGGVIVLAITLLWSSYVQWTIDVINEAEDKFAEAETSSTEASAEAPCVPVITVTVPVDGIGIPITECTKAIRITVPSDTVEYKNSIVGATGAEVTANSWQQYFRYAYRQGDTETILVLPGAQVSGKTFYVNPISESDKIAAEINTSALPANQ